MRATATPRFGLAAAMEPPSATTYAENNMKLTRRVWRSLKKVLPVIGEAFAAQSIKQSLIEQEISVIKEHIKRETPDNPALSGYKVYGQVDEDGIIEHIFQRIGDGNRTFVEIGCGNGSENNTHFLALKGWKGVWVDGSDENVGHIGKFVPLDSPRLLVQRMFVTRDNIAAEFAKWSARLGGSVDLFSLDIDGNDSIVLGQILTVAKPRVLVLEYNGKYPPPVKLSVAYDPAHRWERDDYFGSTLQVFIDQLQGQYRLVTCGVAGANAYFVRDDEASKFTPYPTGKLFMPVRQHLIHRNGAAAPSLKFLRSQLKG